MSIKDEFERAKLISKKDSRHLEHEARVERKRLGNDGVYLQEKQRQKEIQQKLDEQRLRDQQIAREQAEERLEKERSREKEREKIKIEDLIKNAQFEEYGPRKFFFVTRNKKIPYICVSDNLGEKLERGIAGIIEYPTPNGSEFAIVNRQCVERILDIDPEAVRFFNRDLTNR